MLCVYLQTFEAAIFLEDEDDCNTSKEIVLFMASNNFHQHLSIIKPNLT